MRSVSDSGARSETAPQIKEPFIGFSNPEECVEYANLLVDHFNGSIRYGAAMAVAIACAGTANKVLFIFLILLCLCHILFLYFILMRICFQEALACIEPLLSAKESYVRQGAVIATSMIMIEHNEQSCPKVNYCSCLRHRKIYE